LSGCWDRLWKVAELQNVGGAVLFDVDGFHYAVYFRRIDGF
jgi:hypothetical protein